jgi:NAD+ kinase
LERFVAGDYEVEERMTLEVEITRASASESSDTGSPYLVLNEAVVEKTVPGHTVRLSASIAGRPFVTYLADGLLVCTPTGSTAYNLSARGPILSPLLRAIVVTPISAHMLFDRSFVLEPQQWLRLEVAGPRPGILVVDGISVAQLEPGDAVVCREGPVNARLVSLGDRDFHDILRSRFHLADR